MLRLTKKADYGLMALKYLAEQAEASMRTHSARSAKDCTIKEPWRKVNDSIKDLLSGIRIADLMEAAETDPHRASVGGGLVSIAL